MKLFQFKKKLNPADAFDRLVEKITRDAIKMPFSEVNDSLKYIVDIETSRIVWIDEGLEKHVGDQTIGRLCFEVLQGYTHPCNFCTNHQLTEEGKVVQWVHHNDKLGKTYLVRDFLKIMDIEGKERRLRYEMAIEITPQIKSMLRNG